MTVILDGRIIGAKIRDEVAEGVVALQQSHGVTPGLAAVLVGDDAASAVYVRNKGIACEKAGIYSETFNLNPNTSRDELMELIDRLNKDTRFHGVLVQLPLPAGIDEHGVISSIDPLKDVDCIHPVNVGLLSQGGSHFVPATPGGIQQLLVRNGYDIEGKHVVICGRSNIVGKPLAMLLAQKSTGANATVTLCHTATRDLREMTMLGDILVAAIGSPKAIGADMVKEGAIVIDVGINRVEDSSRQKGYRLEGDVDFTNVFDKVRAITPVPGGVGPMTIAMLLVNTLTAAQLSFSEKIQN